MRIVFLGAWVGLACYVAGGVGDSGGPGGAMGVGGCPSGGDSACPCGLTTLQFRLAQSTCSPSTQACRAPAIRRPPAKTIRLWGAVVVPPRRRLRVSGAKRLTHLGPLPAGELGYRNSLCPPLNSCPTISGTPRRRGAPAPRLVSRRPFRGLAPKRRPPRRPLPLWVLTRASACWLSGGDQKKT